nr:uncharacterized protein LOC133601103 [Nerophis lumbriciformis]
MAKHNAGRLVAILLSVVLYGISLVFNGLAALGIGPFSTSTGNVSDVFVTEITPSGWTFSIWSVIYVWLTLMMIYILANICRRWMISALVFLILVASTNYGMVFFICHGLHVYGAWLNKYHKVDLWLIRIVVQNGVMIYTTWTTIATLINLTIVLTYEANLSATDAATVSYCMLAVVLLLWFFLQNVVLDKHVRYILIDYPVVIWALSGNFDKNYNAESPSRSGIFIVVLLAASSLLYVVRLVLVFWRHYKQPLYRGISPDTMEPLEMAKKQKMVLR